MAEQFSVIRRYHADLTALFEGNADSVVQWLITQPDVSGYEVYSPALRAYQSVDEFLRAHVIHEFYKDLVPKFYQMDPKTEDLLYDGTSLADGMVILIATSDERSSLDDLNEEWRKDKALATNRWCKVSNLRVLKRTKLMDARSATVSFIAVYEDGTKRKREYPVGESWFVKIDSIPDPVVAEEKDAEKYNKIYRLVKAAVDAAELRGHSPSAINGAELAEEATKQILGIV